MFIWVGVLEKHSSGGQTPCSNIRCSSGLMKMLSDQEEIKFSMENQRPRGIFCVSYSENSSTIREKHIVTGLNFCQ